MGKASRLRKNSATKLSLKEFHASLVQDKLVKDNIPKVQINLSDLYDNFCVDYEELEEDSHSHSARANERSMRCSNMTPGSHGNLSRGMNLQQQMQQARETPNAMAKVEDRLKKLKAISPSKEDSSLETRKRENISIFNDFKLHTMTSRECAVASQPHTQEFAPWSANFAAGRGSCEEMEDAEFPQLENKEDAIVAAAKGSAASKVKTKNGCWNKDDAKKPVAEEAASVKQLGGNFPSQVAAQISDSNQVVGPTTDFSTPSPRDNAWSSVNSRAAGQSHVGQYMSLLGKSSVAAESNYLKLDLLGSGGATPAISREGKQSAAVLNNKLRNTFACVESGTNESCGPSGSFSRATKDANFSSALRHESAGARHELGPGNSTIHIPNSATRGTKDGITSRVSKQGKGAETSKNSWSNLFNSFEQKKTSKLKQFNVGFEENELKVPIEISKQGYTHWDHAIVGYFLDKWSSFHYVSAWARKIWAEELSEVTTLDNGFYIFNFKSEEALKKVLDGGPYYCGNRLILIKQWHPGMKLNKEEFSSIPIWVKFYNVPLELWSDEGLSYVASVIGKPLFLDEYTQKKSRLAFARICIEVQVEKEIPKSFKLNLGYGSPYEVKVEVPWSPKRCDGCKTFSHTTMACPTKPKEEIKNSKKQWQVKEQREENEWKEVKKVKDKSTLSPKVKSKETSRASTNMFDILQSCHENENPKEEEENNPKSEESNLSEMEGSGGPCKLEPKHKTTLPSPLQAQYKKQLLARIQKFNFTKEQALAATKNSNSKSTKAKKK